jgi:uncharacterized protein (DUF1778 family)
MKKAKISIRLSGGAVRIALRVPVASLRMIERAAWLNGSSTHAFILNSCVIAAEQTVMDQVVFEVTGKQARLLEAMLSKRMLAGEPTLKLLAKRSPWDA